MSPLAVGLMSGTSLDGVDAALVDVAGPHDVRLRAFRTIPFAPADRSAVLEAIARGSARGMALLDVSLGERLADAALAVVADAGHRPADLAFVASHGQTVWHEPGRATLQLGCPAVIAERVGVRVVSGFRTRDVAAGGQGAPLVSIGDVMLFGHAVRGRALLNIGGMANATWVPRRGDMDGVVAFDTGPGNAVIDGVTRLVAPAARFDTGGARAARGRPAAGVLEPLLAHPYFAAPPPKSTGREVFGDVFAAELLDGVRAGGGGDDDAVATALELTVRTIASHLERWLPRAAERDLVVSGGGVRNPVVMRRLSEALPTWEILRFDDVFFDGDAKEAVTFAYLGWRTLEGLPGNVPGATGASGPRVLGCVTPA